MLATDAKAIKERHGRARAGARTILIAAVCLLIGLVLGGLWGYRLRERGGVNTGNPAAAQESVGVSAETTSASQSPGVETDLPPVAPIDSVMTAEVKRLVPNFASVSLEEGTQVLRESALQALNAAASDMVIHLREAEQRLARVQEAGSDAEKQAALKELQRVQADHAAKLRDAAARSATQIETLRRLKAGHGERLTR